MYNDILVPTDGAEGFQKVVENAAAIADKFDAAIHSVYVVDDTAYPDTMDTSYVIEGMEEFGQEKLQEVEEQIQNEGIPYYSEIRVGAPHSQILEYAEDMDVDLIVMGAHGRTGLSRLVVGSVAEKVIRKSDVPVMTVDLGGEDE